MLLVPWVEKTTCPPGSVSSTGVNCARREMLVKTAARPLGCCGK